MGEEEKLLKINNILKIILALAKMIHKEVINICSDQCTSYKPEVA